MKELVGYLREHRGLGIIFLTAVLVGGGLWAVSLFGGAGPRFDFEARGSGTTPLDPSLGPALKFPTSTSTPTPTATAGFMEPGGPGSTGVPAEGIVFLTDTPGAPFQAITTLGQYCQDGRSYTNFKIELPGDITIMEGAYDSASMPTLPADAAGGGLIPLPIISSAGSPVAFIPPEMRCVLVKEDPDSALFNCTGLENSTVPIFVGGVPVDVYFMGCGGNDPKQDEECARRDCR